MKPLLFIANKLMNYCEKNGKIFKITGTAGPEDVYLIRYYVIKSKYCNFFIHQFLRSDRDDLHDHPWDFCTYLVSGAYTENKYNPQTRQVEATRRDITKNRFVFRKATDQHQVVVDKDLKESQKRDAALTFFFSGPTKRVWGFVKEVPLQGSELLASKIEADMYAAQSKHTKRVWVDWREYLGLPSDTPGRG